MLGATDVVSTVELILAHFIDSNYNQAIHQQLHL